MGDRTHQPVPPEEAALPMDIGNLFAHSDTQKHPLADHLSDEQRNVATFELFKHWHNICGKQNWSGGWSKCETIELMQYTKSTSLAEYRTNMIPNSQDSRDQFQYTVADDTSVHMLDSQSHEYQRCEEELFKTIDRATCKLLSVESVNNPGLKMKYDCSRTVMEGQLKQSDSSRIEQQLWHGTDAETCLKILETGFLRDFNTTSHFGYGTYFATNASYSAQEKYATPDNQGVKTLIWARVAVGQSCIGRSGMKETTPIDVSNPKGLKCHSMVNNMQDPSIYVLGCGTDNNAYPEYIIRIRQKQFQYIPPPFKETLDKGVMWFWNSSHTRGPIEWTPFSCTTLVKFLEGCYLSSIDSSTPTTTLFDWKIGNDTYTLDLANNTQTNKRTKFVRKLVRRGDYNPVVVVVDSSAPVTPEKPYLETQFEPIQIVSQEERQNFIKTLVDALYQKLPHYSRETLYSDVHKLDAQLFKNTNRGEYISQFKTYLARVTAAAPVAVTVAAPAPAPVAVAAPAPAPVTIAAHAPVAFAAPAPAPVKKVPLPTTPPTTPDEFKNHGWTMRWTKRTIENKDGPAFNKVYIAPNGKRFYSRPTARSYLETQLSASKKRPLEDGENQPTNKSAKVDPPATTPQTIEQFQSQVQAQLEKSNKYSERLAQLLKGLQ